MWKVNQPDYVRLLSNAEQACAQVKFNIYGKTEIECRREFNLEIKYFRSIKNAGNKLQWREKILYIDRNWDGAESELQKMRKGEDEVFEKIE